MSFHASKEHVRVTLHLRGEGVNFELYSDLRTFLLNIDKWRVESPRGSAVATFSGSN